MTDSLILVFVAAVAFVASGTVKGVLGMGLPPVAIGLLCIVMPPTEAAALVVVPALVTNVVQAAYGGRLRSVALRFWPMLAGVILGSALASGFMAGAPDDLVFAAVGGALGLYGLLGLASVTPPEPGRYEVVVSPVVGLLTGMVAAATGVTSLPSAPYLSSLRLTRNELVQALGVTFSIGTLGLAGSLSMHGALGAAELAGSSAAMIPALVGMAAGARLRQVISEIRFRKLFHAGLLAIGVHLAVSPWL